MIFTIEFGDLVDHDSPCRHIDTDGKSFGSKYNFDQPASKTCFNNFFECRNNACVMRSDACFELLNELRELQSHEIIISEVSQALVRYSNNLLFFKSGSE